MKKISAITLLALASLLSYSQESKTSVPNPEPKQATKAEESKSSTPKVEAEQAPKAQDYFTSMGETWVEIDGGVSIGHYKLDNVFSNYKTNGAASISSNLMLDKRDYLKDQITIGIDLGVFFEYSHGQMNTVAMDDYSFGSYIKPYVTFYKSSYLNISAFVAPYFSYTRLELAPNPDGDYDNVYKLGFVAGMEFAFLEDFYITPAYRYTRTQGWDYAGSGYDQSTIEVEAGYRIYKNVSLHLKYAHDFQKCVIDVKTSRDVIMGGVRYTF